MGVAMAFFSLAQSIDRPEGTCRLELDVDMTICKKTNGIGYWRNNLTDAHILNQAHVQLNHLSMHQRLRWEICSKCPQKPKNPIPTCLQAMRSKTLPSLS